MRRHQWIAILTICLVWLVSVPSIASGQSDWMSQAEDALKTAAADIGVSPGQGNLLVLTNAGYGQAGSDTTEAFLDVAYKVTGCSLGARNCLPVHASILDPFWFALFRKDTSKLIFVKWTGDGFDSQALDASPEKILTPEGWGEAQKGLIGPKLFSVVSLSLTWAVDPPWPLLLAAAFHDHFCPGVNSGYIAGQYLMDKLPLGDGDQYVFVSAPAKCAADALQVMFNTTTGKSGGFSMAISGKKLKEYALDGVTPMTVAMRVNGKKDECAGLVLGFDWSKAFEASGVKSDELAPQGGRSNPMFWMARVRMSRELAALPKEQLLGMIVQLKSFSGPAAMVDQISGGDPYQTVLK